MSNFGLLNKSAAFVFAVADTEAEYDKTISGCKLRETNQRNHRTVYQVVLVQWKTGECTEVVLAETENELLATRLYDVVEAILGEVWSKAGDIPF